MGVGCPEYVLLFRKLPTDKSTAYADEPVVKTKAEYTRGQWQLDAHAYWRSSGNTLLSKEQMKAMPIEQLQRVYHEFSKGSVYDFAEHVRLVEELDNENRLPASFMVCSPASWSDRVWDDIARMRTLNSEQSRRNLQMHVCPFQLDQKQRVRRDKHAQNTVRLRAEEWHKLRQLHERQQPPKNSQFLPYFTRTPRFPQQKSRTDW